MVALDGFCESISAVTEQHVSTQEKVEMGLAIVPTASAGNM